MLYVVIEIGTNSTKLCIAKRHSESWEMALENIAYTRLGENFSKQKIIEQKTMLRNISAIEAFLEEAEQYHPDVVSVIATQAVRIAENAGEFTQLITAKTGLPVAILSAEQEAYYSYLAAMQDGISQEQSTMFFDIGGGSTELFQMQKDNFMFVSLPFGAVTLTELFSPHSKETAKELEHFVYSQLENSNFIFSGEKIIGIGGTVVSMQKTQFFLSKNQDLTLSKLTIWDVEKQIEYFMKKLPEEIAAETGLPLLRADIIFAGTIVVFSLMKFFQLTELEICKKGVRHGFMIENWRKNETVIK
jgi:exopolyphosphatase/guanosine-5'-triphosphate,3'-diphosphate pyrophosphatase